MKTPLLLLLLLIAGLTSAQTQNQLIVAGQPGFNLTETQSFNLSGMAGIKTFEGDQFLAGIIYKHLIPKVGHQANYLGLRFHAQTSLSEKIATFLSADFLRGEYYTYGRDDVFIKKTMHINGTLGMAYMLSKNIGLFAGYSVRDYNPLRYYTEQKSPHKSGSISIKLSVALALEKAFLKRGGAQRRMW